MKALTMICAVVLTLCWAAFANPAGLLNVHFSQPVLVGDATLPAGNVTITVDRGGPNVFLTFRSESGLSSTVVANRISDTEDRPDTLVVLERTAAGLKVDKIWLGDHTGFALAQ